MAGPERGLGSGLDFRGRGLRASRAMPGLQSPLSRRCAAAAVAVVLGLLLAGVGAAAAGGPSAGIELGIAELNTSGQVGSVTLTAGGPTTRVAVAIVGARGRREPVRIYRGRSCAQLGTRPAFSLAPLSTLGFSHSTVRATAGRLRSGSYDVVVLSSAARTARPVACGHLF